MSSEASHPFTLPEFVSESRGDFIEIMEMLDKRLNDKGKNWRHVFKACGVTVLSSSENLTFCTYQ